ncbi:hypothetical protein ACJDU8_24055 [Clostridium sp. WILCCON 0269]|uniref:Uncharacterized protein n=1 Tax=Candidatus Clostridium eludens TaxID=3381663 RepID=A0ABW8SRK0_9CLOT
MDADLKSKFPSWTKKEEMKKGKIDWLMSDDIDSWASIVLLQHLFGKQNKANYFIDFNQSYINKHEYKCSCQQIYVTNELSNDELIGVDVALDTQTMCFDNHCCMLIKEDIEYKNQYSANINNIFNVTRLGDNGLKDGYYRKYAGSTLLTIMSLYNLDIGNWDEEMLTILCCIDSLFIPQKIRKVNFKSIQDKYLKLMGYEYLIKFMEEKINSSGYRLFEEAIKKYNLKDKIIVGADGKLQTSIRLDLLSEVFALDLSLPNTIFKEHKRCDKFYRNLDKYPIREDEYLLDEGEYFLNFSVVTSNSIVYSKGVNRK